MKKSTSFREVTILMPEDCFVVASRVKPGFNYPIHIHPEFELNFVENAVGSQRIVGDSIEEIGDLDLCLIGNEKLEHTWVTHNCKTKEIHEIMIQFHKDMYSIQMLQKKQFHSIAVMLENAKKGVVFSREAIIKIKPKLERISKLDSGYYSVIDLYLILYELSLDKNMRVLSSSTFCDVTEDSSESRRIQKIVNYLKLNFQKDVHLKDVAKLVNMHEKAFGRYMKLRTGKNFIEHLNDLRLGYASRLLVDTTKTVSEIAYESGFTNISNFNRIFKKKRASTPKEFREYYQKIRIMI